MQCTHTPDTPLIYTHASACSARTPRVSHMIGYTPRSHHVSSLGCPRLCMHCTRTRPWHSPSGTCMHCNPPAHASVCITRTLRVSCLLVTSICTRSTPPLTTSLDHSPIYNGPSHDIRPCHTSVSVSHSPPLHVRRVSASACIARAPFASSPIPNGLTHGY